MGTFLAQEKEEGSSWLPLIGLGVKYTRSPPS